MKSHYCPPFWNLDGVQGFILDWDGILANTRLDFTAVRDKFFGGEIVPLIERARALPHPLCDEVCDAIVQVEMDGANRATPVDGAHELIEWLESKHKPWAVVSRNCRDSITLAAKRCDITLPDVVMCREDDISKPDPRALVLAAERIGVSPSDCLMVGDFVFDMLGARRVPMRCALVDGNVQAWGHMADLVCPTMRDFLEELHDSRLLIPWEYRALAHDRGEDYLIKINRVSCRIENFYEALEAARAGVVRLVVAHNAKLTIDEWASFDIDPKFIDQPLADVLSEILPRRWPMVSVMVDTTQTASESVASLLKTLHVSGRK